MMQKFSLSRRGVDFGEITAQQLTSSNHDQLFIQHCQQAWQQGAAIKLSGIGSSQLESFTNEIANAQQLYEQVLSGEFACDELLDQEPYQSRLQVNFENLGSSVNQGDDQEIETVLFDGVSDQEVVAEDLWMKASWLSFHDEDASLRFRFSFGVDLHEDVAADKHRQYYAAKLADAVFPESELVTRNKVLLDYIHKILELETNQNFEKKIEFVERIIYFNSPNGGAYLHHDRERGHAGVVFAQLSGETFWLALSKKQLYQQLKIFYQSCLEKNIWPENLLGQHQTELTKLVESEIYFNQQIESFANDALIQTINETPAFIQQLAEQGYSHHLQAGDMLLLPQETEENCCWHSVFCVGEKTGQALSFAIRVEE